MSEGERLQKVLARTGIGSRRHCEGLIEGGHVRVNGKVARLGTRIDPEIDHVPVDGVPLGVRPGAVPWLLNKPGGVITPAHDPQGRGTVLDLVPAEPRVFPVGRLDADTEGLLVLTNDGDLAQLLTHPSHGVEKEYLAHVEGTPSRGAVRRLREGIELDDGPTAPAQASLAGPSLIRLTTHEGRNRQVRRMCEAIGHPVIRLVRTRIGPLTTRKLAPGDHRALTTAEVLALREAATPRPRSRAERRAEAFGDPSGPATGPTPRR